MLAFGRMMLHAGASGRERILARLVFRRSRPGAVARDLASRLVTLDRALTAIRRLLEDRPEL